MSIVLMILATAASAERPPERVFSWSTPTLVPGEVGAGPRRKLRQRQGGGAFDLETRKVITFGEGSSEAQIDLTVLVHAVPGRGGWSIGVAEAWMPQADTEQQATLLEVAADQGAQPFRVWWPRDGSVSHTAGPPPDGEAAAAMLDQILQALTLLWVPFPEGPVGPGASWTAHRTFDADWEVPLTQEVRCTLDGWSGPVVQVQVDSTLRSNVTDEAGTTAIVLQVGGTVWIDMRRPWASSARLEGEEVGTAAGSQQAPSWHTAQSWMVRRRPARPP